MIKALQKRLPGSNPLDWSNGGGVYDAGVIAVPLNAENATNLADILAIGKKRWEQKFADGKSLANCFPNGGKRIASTYPQFDLGGKQVVTFEGAINRCLQLHREPMIDPARADQYAELMGPLSAYARSLSDGQKLGVRVANSGALDRYEAGRRLFHQRIGQQDFACASCHVQHAGSTYGEVGLAPAVGQAATWPRVEAGGRVRTLQAQFQRCMARSGAVPFEIASDELNNLELYLSYLSNGLVLRPLSAVR
jgi:sulfur-oxidizing protein SoxA